MPPAGPEEEDACDELAPSSPPDRSSTLFAGQKLWLSHRIPQREWLVQNAKLNGAVIVPLEKQADVILVDHAKQGHAAGTHSYKYVELSIRKGALENLDDHVVVPKGTVRTVGSVVVKSKGGRTPYTDKDDQLLYDFVKPFELMGGPWKGNDIYQQLAKIHPHHPWQSWRDRYVKYVRHSHRTVSTQPEVEREERRVATTDEPRTSVATDGASEHQGAATTSIVPQSQPQRRKSPVVVIPSSRHKSRPRSPSPQVSSANPLPSPRLRPEAVIKDKQPVLLDFTPEEIEMLMKAAGPILSVPDGHDLDSAWERVSNANTVHTAAEWRSFFDLEIVPAFLKKIGKTKEEFLSSHLTDTNKASIDTDEGPLEDENETANRRVRDGSPTSVKPEVLVTEGNSKQAAQSSRSLQVESDLEDDTPDKTCSHCFTKSTKKWRKDKQGNSLCDECGRFLRANGVLRPSTAWTEVGDVHEEDEEEEQATAEEQNEVTRATPVRDVAARTSTPTYSPKLVPERPKSPSFEPESPKMSRLPEPNEARKRSAVRSTQSTSQESKEVRETLEPLEDLGEGETDRSLETRVAELKEEIARQEKGLSIQSPAIKKASSMLIQALKHELHLIVEGEDDASPLDAKRRREAPELTRETGSPELGASPNPKRRKEAQLEEDPNRLRLPSSLEDQQFAQIFSNQEQLQYLDLPPPDLPERSASPGRLSRRKATPPASPMFAENDDEDETMNGRNEARDSPEVANVADTVRPESLSLDENEERQSSPLAIHLVSERDHNQSTLSPQPRANRPVSDSESEMGVFETAQDDSHAWATAPATLANVRDKVDIEPQNPTGTKALFRQPLATTTIDEFALPDPEGGWDNLDMPDSNTLEEATLRLPSPDINAEDLIDDDNAQPAFSPPTLEEWLTSQTHLHSSVPDIRNICLTAFQATVVDYNLATSIVEDLVRQQKRGKYPADTKVRLPVNMKGCWTQEDDDDLLDKDARSIERLEKKHGRDAVNRRFEYLGEWYKDA